MDPFRMFSKDSLPPASTRILVLDPDPWVAETVVELLEFSGMEVTRAENRDDALLLLSSRAFDVMVAHLGFFLARNGELRQRAAARQPSMRIVVMTGSGARLEASARVTVLDKPFSKQQLLDAMEQSVGARPDPCNAAGR
jgi:DNA-binding NtrC family response regulator